MACLRKLLTGLFCAPGKPLGLLASQPQSGAPFRRFIAGFCEVWNGVCTGLLLRRGSQGEYLSRAAWMSLCPLSLLVRKGPSGFPGWTRSSQARQVNCRQGYAAPGPSLVSLTFSLLPWKSRSLSHGREGDFLRPVSSPKGPPEKAVCISGHERNPRELGRR